MAIGLRQTTAGRLPAAELDLVARWIALNEIPSIEFWNGAIDTVELATRLRKLPSVDETKP